MKNNLQYSRSLIRLHLVFSGVSFFLFSLFLVFSSKEIGMHYFQSKILALTHIAALCWFTPFLFALFYQHVPQLFGRKLYSHLLAKISFWLLAAGSLMLVHAFWLNRFDKLLTLPAHILLFPFLLLFINVVITAIKSKNKGIVHWFFIASVFWLLFTSVVGFLLAMNFTKPMFSASHLEWLKLHANIGFVGWMLQFIIGVSAHKYKNNEKTAMAGNKVLRAAFLLINTGLLFYFFVKGHNLPQMVNYSMIVVTVGVFAALLQLIYKFARQINHGTTRALLSFFVLIVPFVLAFYLVFTSSQDHDFIARVGVVYGVSILLGFVGLWTFSQLPDFYEIIYPLQKIKANETRVKVRPKIISMMHFSSYIVAISILVIGILTKQEPISKVASIVLLISAVLFNIMLFKALLAKKRKVD